MSNETELAKRMRADRGDKFMKRVVTQADLYDLVDDTIDVLSGFIRELRIRVDALESAKQGDSQ